MHRLVERAGDTSDPETHLGPGQRIQGAPHRCTMRGRPYARASCLRRGEPSRVSRAAVPRRVAGRRDARLPCMFLESKVRIGGAIPAPWGPDRGAGDGSPVRQRLDLATTP